MLDAQAVGSQVGQVHNGQFVPRLFGCHPELDFAAGAGGDQRLGTGVNSFLQAVITDDLGRLRILQQAKDSTAAVSVLPIMLHLYELKAGNGLQHLARRFVYALRATGAAHMARVVPGDLHRYLVSKSHFAAFDALSDDLGVMLALNVILYAQLFGPFGIVVSPRQPAGRAGGNHRLDTPGLHAGDVVPQDLFPGVPLAGDQHRQATAGLAVTHVGELDASSVQELRRALSHVGLYVAGGAAGEVTNIGPPTDLIFQFLGYPGRAVGTVAGPDIALLAKRGTHDLKGREGQAILLVDQLATHLQPGRLDGQLQRAFDIAHLARCAGHEIVYPVLGHFGPAFHELPQEEPLAAR